MVFLILLIASNSILLGQSNIRRGFRFGKELKNYLSEETGTFDRTFDYTFGGFTGINMHSFPDAAVDGVKKGDQIIPDYIVKPTLADIINNKDATMEYVQNLIQEDI